MKKGDCEGCKKQATVHIQEISGGKSVEKHYCDSCPKLQGEHLAAKPHTPINELLTNFVLAHSGSTPETTVACTNCELTWSEFKSSGLLGCENDYVLFEKDLTQVIQRAHEGATHHVGKTPGRRQALAKSPAAKKKSDLTKLKRDLQKAVESEDYEKAASLRDQIRKAELPS